ncbi:MAG: FG-GAP repeat protein [Flavobacteriales bacterium]|nr:FG-GAP repeat protein [Flavobacteriales bacterium]
MLCRGGTAWRVIIRRVLPVALGLLSGVRGGHGPDVARMESRSDGAAMTPMASYAAGSTTEAEPSAYRIVPTGAACTFSSSNPTHGLAVDYTSTGFTLFPSADRRGPHVAFLFEGLGRNGATERPGPLAGQQVADGTLEVELGTVRMRYRNDAHGMRHDVIVHAKPQGDGRLEARFRLQGGLPAMQSGPDEVVFHRFDEQAVALVPAIRYSGLKAWDAQGRVLPATMELHDDALVLAVVDEDAEYPITIDPLSSTPDREIVGAAGEKLGHSVATAGDVDGDGYSDILVGSPGWGTPFAGAGRVQLFLGSASGIPATPVWTYQGVQANDSLGLSVSSAGDINGDGYSDVAIGAPGRNGANAGAGAVLVFLSTGSGLGATPSYTLTDATGTANAAFGRSVALAGRVNNDDYSDIVVGAPRDNVSRGKAYCYHGGPSTLTLGWSAAGALTNNRFGFSVAGAGDLNGDGYSDVVIGEPGRIKSVFASAGAIHLFQGSAGGLVAASPSLQQPVSNSGANFGYSVSCAGDMNGDGYADIVVGAPGRLSGDGSIYVYRGASNTMLLDIPSQHAVPLVRDGSLSSTERFGYSVGLAGDVNGDGYADIVVGAPNSSSNNGKAQVLGGSATIDLNAAPLLTVNGSAMARLGAAVCTAGDVNGDGISDLLLAAPDQGGTGAAKVFHGAPDMPATTASWSIQGTVNSQFVGKCVASAGDVNGDGYSDVLVGVPGGPGMKGEVRLFYGSATGLPATPSWTKQGENVEDRFGSAVASAGDVNGDGYSDVIIGAPGWPNGVSGAWRGKAYLFLGSASGLSATATWTNTGPASESRYGYSLGSAGDVNGDGYSDVIIGAPSLNNGPGTGAGVAYVYHGSGAGLPASADWTIQSQQHRTGHSSDFGSSVSLAGDVNGDGYDDVIIGDHFYEHDDPMDGANRGAAFVFHGSPAGLSPAPNWAAYGASDGDEFGSSVSYAGDVNGDGYSDVIIGAYKKGAAMQGGAYVYLGSPAGGLGAVAVWAINGVFAGDQVGESVCSAGDVNGDGYGDVVVGSSTKDALVLVPYSYKIAAGNVAVYLGAAAGPSATPAWSVDGANAGDKIGVCAALAGDVNGDGYSDIVSGIGRMPASPYSDAGGALLYPGNAGRGLSMPTFQYRSNMTPVRTSNGTFQSDCEWVIGQYARSSMGRAKVKLVWHNEGHGPVVPFHAFDNNSTAFSGEQAAWANTTGTLLTQTLSTAPGVTGHPQWRARIRYHPTAALDGRVFGPWHMQGVHDLQVPSLKTEYGTCGLLPVELLSLHATCTGGGTHLEWATATERNCATFLVERSADAHRWERLGVVACAGTSSTPQRYSFNDVALLHGPTYYRLQQVDADGSVNMLPTVTVEACAQAAGTMQAWPNPVSDVLHVDHRNITGQLSESVVIEVIDATGRPVATLTAQHDAGPAHIGMAGMAAGVYAVVARSADGTLLGHVRVVRE